MSSSALVIRPVSTKKDKKDFINLAWDVYRNDPHWVPPLKDEVNGLITPGKNPWFEHAKAEFWLAERDGKVWLGSIGTSSLAWFPTPDRS